VRRRVGNEIMRRSLIGMGSAGSGARLSGITSSNTTTAEAGRRTVAVTARAMRNHTFGICPGNRTGSQRELESATRRASDLRDQRPAPRLAARGHRPRLVGRAARTVALAVLVRLTGPLVRSSLALHLGHIRSAVEDHQAQRRLLLRTIPHPPQPGCCFSWCLHRIHQVAVRGALFVSAALERL